MSLSSTLSFPEQESTLRYLASRMMGDTWIACQLAKELSTLSPPQQLHRLRAFLAAATISNTVATEVCQQYGLQVGFPKAGGNISENVPAVQGRGSVRRRVTPAAAQSTVQHYTDQLLSPNH